MIFWSLSRQVFVQNLFNHIRLLFCGISDTSNNFFFERILPLHVCSIFTGFLLTKSSFCTSISFFKSCKNRGRPQRWLFRPSRPVAWPLTYLEQDLSVHGTILPGSCPWAGLGVKIYNRSPRKDTKMWLKISL